MLLRVCCGLLLIAGVTPVIVLSAADSTPPRVPGFERFYTVPLMTLDEEVIPVDPVTGGRLLLGELNCLSCHAASNEIKAVVSTKQAPILDEIGSRARVDWLREYLQLTLQTGQFNDLRVGETVAFAFDPQRAVCFKAAVRAG